MGAETNLERELKFDVDPDFDPPDLRSVVGRTERLPEQHLITTYLDTADKRLWARGITLRHRLQSEGDAPARPPGKWTLKLPVQVGTDDDGMARSELSWTGPLDTVPAEAASIVAGLVRRAPLEPVVVLATDRRRLLLHDEDRPWAEIDDDLATVTSGRREGLRFRQLEIELLNGDGPAEPNPAVLDTVVAEFRRAGATPGGGAKLALAAGLDGDPGERTAKRRGVSDIRSFASATLSVDLALLLDCDYRLRVPDDDGDPAGFDSAAVHSTAAAISRLRSDLRVLGAVMDPVWVKHVRSDLRWMAGVLERLEDEDVLVERVLSHVDGAVVGAVDPQTVDELLVLLRSDRHLGATELTEALASTRYAEMLDRVQAAVREPPLFDVAGGGVADGSLEVVLRSVVAAYWRAVDTEIQQLGSRPGDEALDHLRALSARLAHAAAMAQPYLGQRAGKTASASARLESVLSRLRRSDHAARALAEVASHPAVTAPVAFVAGLVAGRAEGDSQFLRADWQKAAKKLRKSGKSVWAR